MFLWILGADPATGKWKKANVESDSAKRLFTSYLEGIA